MLAVRGVHTFPNLYADFLQAYSRGESPATNFQDAARTQAVLQVIERSDVSRIWIDVSSP
jgi:hypothetical protein